METAAAKAGTDTVSWYYRIVMLERTIENLRERPKHEREAIAFWIAVAVVIILTIGWGTFFFRTLSIPDLQPPVNAAYNQAVQEAGAAQSEAPLPPDGLGWVSTSQPEDSSNAAEPIQIIQEGGTTDSNAQVQ